MDHPSAHQRNQDAYRQLATFINQSFPAGQYVALVDGAIVADADQFETIVSRLRAMGADLRTTMVVQAGVEYPETALILSTTPSS